jgi:hypothetical protein
MELDDELLWETLRLHAILSLIMTLLSLRNAIQCGCSWHGCGQSGLAVLPASTGERKSLLLCIMQLNLLT